MSSSIGRGGRILASLAAATLTVSAVAGGAAAQERGPGAAAGAAASSPLSPFAARKAERLLREQLPCLGCHTLGDEGGKIGPDLTTVRARRSAAYVAAMVADPQATAPAAAMPKVAMPEATRLLVVRYLASRPGSAGGAAPAPAAAPRPAAADGAALYARWCAACHGAGGNGDGPNAPFLPVEPAVHADAKAMALRPDDSLYDTIAGGGGIMNRSPRMPPFGATLSAAEIRALVAHIRALCRCQGPEWSRDGSPGRGSR